MCNLGMMNFTCQEHANILTFIDKHKGKKLALIKEQMLQHVTTNPSLLNVRRPPGHLPGETQRGETHMGTSQYQTKYCTTACGSPII
jgi:hypothetical protein